MKKILLRGPLLTRSGYGEHSRQIARWLLNKSNLDVYLNTLPWGNTPWLLNPNLEDGLIGKLHQIAKPLKQPADVSFQIQLPNEWDPRLAKYNVGITAAIETDKCDPNWITACNRMSCIVVPSTHAAKSLTNTGAIKVPMHIIPEAFHDSILNKYLPQSPLPDNITTNFNFLVFGQITGNNPENDRKNIFYTIRWLCEEFKNDPNVGIILKTNLSRDTKIDRDQVLSLVNQIVNEVREGTFPKIHILHGTLTSEEVASIYRHPSVKALVSLTRGEGFGLPILEAAAAGLPVIATGWSGYMDFLNQGKFIKLGYQLNEIHNSRIDGKLFVKGAKWANVSEVEVKNQLRKFHSNPRQAQEWAKSLSEKLIKSHNFSAISKLYENVFKQVL